MTDQEKDELLKFAKQKFEDAKNQISVFFSGQTPKKQGDYVQKLNAIFEDHSKKLLQWKEELDTVVTLQQEYFTAANAALQAEAVEVSGYVALVVTYQKYFTSQFTNAEKIKVENWEEKNRAHEEVRRVLTKSYEAVMTQMTLSRSTLDDEFSRAIKNLLDTLK